MSLNLKKNVDGKVGNGIVAMVGEGWSGYIFNV